MSGETQTSNSTKDRMRWLIPVLLILVSALLVGERYIIPLFIAPNSAPRPIVPRGDLADIEKSTVELFNQAAPSVAHITTRTIKRDSFSLNLMEIDQGTGSGFVWDRQGHVVTNFHVIAGANRYMVGFTDQSVYEAKLVGAAPDKDLAVLKLQIPHSKSIKLAPLSLGTSSDLQVGQQTFAIGNPFGLDYSLTTGVVSALGRVITSMSQRRIHGAIQTDAAINPGNSGGPLLDSAGRLIGVNTSIYSPSGAFAGVGFAIPVDTVRRVVPQLIKHGRLIRPGLNVEWASERIAQRLRIEGVLVLSVTANSSAEKAGLRPTIRDEFGRLILGDIVTAVDTTKVKSLNDLLDAFEVHKIGDSVSLTVQRQRSSTTLKVILEASQ